jgi:hypothetical protein
MSGEARTAVSGWTLDTLAEYTRQRFESDTKLYEERDRRYSEVSQEREKALKIKEQADRDALALARDIQVYKDEKANELREQINRERVLYATHDNVNAAVSKLEVTIAPLLTFVSQQQGRSTGSKEQWGYIVTIVGLLLVLIGLYLKS